MNNLIKGMREEDNLQIFCLCKGNGANPHYRGRKQWRGEGFVGEGDSFALGHIELHVPMRYPSEDIKGGSYRHRYKGERYKCEPRQHRSGDFIHKLERDHLRRQCSKKSSVVP